MCAQNKVDDVVREKKKKKNSHESEIYLSWKNRDLSHCKIKPQKPPLNPSLYI